MPLRLNLSSIIDVPATSPDEARRKRLMNILLIALSVPVFLSASLSIFLGPHTGLSFLNNPNDVMLLWTMAGYLVAAPFLIALNRSKKVPSWLSSGPFLLVLLLLLVVSDTPAQLANGRSLVAFAVPIVMAAFLLKPFGSLIFSFLVSFEVIILTWVARIPGPPNLIAITIFFFLGFTAWVAARNNEQSIGEIRKLAGQRGAILQGIADGVMLFDPNGIVASSNPAAAEMLSCALDGVHIGDLVKQTSNKASGDALLSLVWGRETFAQIYWNGLTLRLSGSKIKDLNDKLIGVAVVLHDVTKEAQVERTKDTILAVSSHELRTPLTVIMGYAEMIAKALGAGRIEQARELAAAIVKNSKRLNNTINSLNTLAEIQAGVIDMKMQPVQVSEILEGLGPFRLQADEKGLTFNFDSSLPLNSTVTTDPLLFRQILESLVGNAIKFTHKGYVKVHLFQPDSSHWGVEISDTGDGIPEENLSRVFEPFVLAGNDYATRTYQGIGLGLTIAKQLVEKLKGTISAKSNIGAGSTFVVTLP